MGSFTPVTVPVLCSPTRTPFTIVPPPQTTQLSRNPSAFATPFPTLAASVPLADTVLLNVTTPPTLIAAIANTTMETTRRIAPRNAVLAVKLVDIVRVDVVGIWIAAGVSQRQNIVLTRVVRECVHAEVARNARVDALWYTVLRQQVVRAAGMDSAI